MARRASRWWLGPGLVTLAGVLLAANALSGAPALWVPLGAAVLALSYPMWRQALQPPLPQLHATARRGR